MLGQDRFISDVVQCASVPGRPGPSVDQLPSGAATVTSAKGHATSAVDSAYRSWLVRGLLNASSDVSRDLLLRVLEAAVHVVAAFDSRGERVQEQAPSSRELSDSLVALGKPRRGDDVAITTTEGALSLLFRYPLDHDLMALHKLDAARSAEAKAREAHDLAKASLREQEEAVEALRVRAARGVL